MIEAWHDHRLCHPQAITRAAEAFAPEHVGIFSFAVHGARDRERYRSQIDPLIERLTGLSADLVVDMSQMVALAYRTRQVRFADAADYLDAYTKDMAFLAWAGGMHERSELLLVDDVVEPLIAEQPRQGNRLTLTTPHEVALTARPAAKNPIPDCTPEEP